MSFYFRNTSAKTGPDIFEYEKHRIHERLRTGVHMRMPFSVCSIPSVVVVTRFFFRTRPRPSFRGDVQHWELLPAQAALNVRVGSIGGGSLGFPEFPKWLGNYSRENKRRRLLGELSTHLNASISGGTEVKTGGVSERGPWVKEGRGNAGGVV